MSNEQDNPGNSQQVQGENEVEAPIEGARMTFFEHLGELANRLKKCLYAFIIAFAVVSALPDPVNPVGGAHALFGYNFLVLSLLFRAQEAWLHNIGTFQTGLMDSVSIFINVSLVISVIVALPFIFYEIYGFVAPGLYSRERRAVRKYLLPFTILFATGSLFGLFIIFPIIMNILIIFMKAVVTNPLIPINDFVNLLLLVPTLTGIAFTFPVYLVPLVEFKVLKVSQLVKARKWVYVLVCLAVGLVNPDPTFISSIPIVIPIFILFEITILLAKRIENKRAKAAALLAEPQA